MAIHKETLIHGELSAYVAHPEQPATAGMLLVPMITGNGAQLRAFADSIAETGVLALSWDPFHGPSSDDTSFDELMKLGGKVVDAPALGELAQWVDYMFKTLTLQKVGVIGWCMGGRLALILASRESRFSNCIAYHATIRRPMPANHTVDAVAVASNIQCPVEAVYPGRDDIVPNETYADLHKALTSRSAPTVAQYFPQAEHGFMDARRQGTDANRSATKMAWPQTLAFIAATVG